MTDATQNDDSSQANQYDKIVRENLELFLPAFIRKVLGIEVLFSEDLPDTIQYTLERRPDVLKRIRDEHMNEFVLHIEFQSANDARMLKRMLFYRAMLFEKYELPISQYVVYMGSGRPTMPTSLMQERLTFSYPLLTLSELPMSLFLSSDKPQEVVLAILADFGKTPVIDAIMQIIHKVQVTSPSPLALNRHIRHLRILANLRKLSPQIDKIMEGLLEFFKEEEDVLYVRGERKGKEEGKEEGREEAKMEAARELLTKTSLSAAEIGRILDLSPETMQTIQDQLRP